MVAPLFPGSPCKHFLSPRGLTPRIEGLGLLLLGHPVREVREQVGELADQRCVHPHPVQLAWVAPFAIGGACVQSRDKGFEQVLWPLEVLVVCAHVVKQQPHGLSELLLPAGALETRLLEHVFD